MRVGLFVSCLVDQLFPEVGRAALRLLQRAGVQVEYDPKQICCGQPAFNSGFPREAARVAGTLLPLAPDLDWMVVPSGSCATMMRVFLPQLFPAGSEEACQAARLASRTRELSEFLVDVLGVERTGAVFPATVTYHDACHPLRELGVRDQPRRLLAGVEGLRLLELEESERCCGFGGTFSVKFAGVSSSLGRDKIRAIQASGAQYVVSTDVSCLMHLEGLLKRENIPVRTMHLAPLLAHFPEERPLK